jgi:putative PIN family toxin of toxin-antitoxin system
MSDTKSVFVDTNILFSGFIKPQGNCRQAIRLLSSYSNWRAVTSAYVFNELYNQQLRPRFNRRFSRENLITYIYLLLDIIPIVNPAKLGETLRHTEDVENLSPKDLHVWAAFKASNCDYLLTGNTKDFPPTENVVTPSELLAIVTKV